MQVIIPYYMEKEEAKIRDFILELAEKKCSLVYSDFTVEEKRIWKYLLDEIENDGYIRCTRLTAAAWIDITGKGILFLDGGGYTGIATRSIKQDTREIIKNISIEIGKVFLNRIAGGE